MMSALLVAMLGPLEQPPATARTPVRTGAADSVQVCVRDAVTSAPVVGATVRFADGTSRVLDGACMSLPRTRSTMIVARVGYRPDTVAIGASAASDGAPTLALLVPRTHAMASGATSAGVTPSGIAPTGIAPTGIAPTGIAPARLTTQRVTAAAPVAARAGAVPATLEADAARERGVSTMNGVIALLPYTTLRSARGESGLSLRGARREQVVITLDGLPLNDPATGLADVSDLPLAAVHSATVVPGADPLGAGSGASGGVLALSTAPQRVAHLRTGAFGHWAAEGAWTHRVRGARVHGSLSHRRVANDFAFLNEGGAVPVRERRINNDEVRTVATASVVAARTQWMALASIGERGMVGAANVRAYDEDRSRTARVLLRGETDVAGTLLTTGLRHFTLAYRNPASPALDARATAWAADVEWRGRTGWGAWRIGSGGDGLTGTGNVVQRRARGFASWAWQRVAPDRPVRDVSARDRLDFDVGVRADAVERHGVQPTGSAGLSWRALGTRAGSSLAVLARTAQAVRVPTLYDLYFSSPQRLAVRALDPERVTLDASMGLHATWQGRAWRGRAWRATGEGTLVSRDTRNAIVWFPGNFGWSPANVGRERLRGTEVRAEVAAGELMVSAWHTWYRTTLRSGLLDIPTPYVPQHSAAVTGAWRRWGQTLSANVRYQGRRPFTAGPRNPLFELPAVTITDVAWSRRFASSHLDALLSVALENVTDVRWQSVRGFPMPGRGWSAALTFSPQS